MWWKRFYSLLVKSLRRKLCLTPSSSIRMISSIPRTQIIMNPYLYPWWLVMNSDICPPNCVTSIRRMNMVTISIRPLARAQSANAEWSGLRNLVWSIANPPTTTIRRSVNILDSGIPIIVGSATLLNHFSSISSAVKSIMKSPSHWIDGYFSSIFAIHHDATTMRMIEIIRPIPRFTTFPWLAPATARTLSRDIATSAIMMVLMASPNPVADLPPSSWCSLARISR